jgi:hypothetical protein
LLIAGSCYTVSKTAIGSRVALARSTADQKITVFMGESLDAERVIKSNGERFTT